ncbi:glycosyltransferase [Microbacterium sp. GXS0129]|uniref:glycosyltransferase n=1 Tax=Microbacterium sp. GXS0129 TaxID=3377836 RepID=UPI00383B728C
MSLAPRLTIVIPVHNDESTVAGALDSCLVQTMRNIEVICVDDASTDGTARVLEEYAERDPRVRVIRQSSNKSAFQARRAGILAAQAEYVLFLDGDDELLDTAAERSLAVAEEHKADLVGFAVEVVGADGRTVGGYQERLKPKFTELSAAGVLQGLFPVDKPAQGQLWRYLFRTQIVREAYAMLPADLVLPRVNDLPLLYLVAALAQKFVSVSERLYRYHYGRGGSGQVVDTMAQAEFYADAIRSISSIEPAVRLIARKSSDPAELMDNYESVRLSIIGYVTSYLLAHTTSDLMPQMLDHLHTCTPALDLAVAAVRFYPSNLPALKEHSKPVDLKSKNVRNVLLTTRALTTGGVSGVLLAQANFLMAAGYNVTIVARRFGSERNLVPQGAHFIEMGGSGLPDRLAEWSEICQDFHIDVVIDHQVLYSRDWPEYALVARGLGVATIGWLHNFAGRPIYDLNGLHELLKANASLLEKLISLSPLDVAFWKLRGVLNSAYVPNPPSPLLMESARISRPKKLANERLELVWWGRLDEHTKRVSQLIEVAAQLRKLSVDFQLTVIGPKWQDWTATRFNAEVRRRRLHHFVRAVGERRGEELLAAIDSADAFVSTSIIEGYQLTIAEAQIRGLPVFMYELPWLTLVQDNDGIVATPQQNPAGLAQAIAAVSRDPARYEALSRASISAANREIAYDFSQLYQQVVTDTLPEEFSPEPTFEDARRLLDLMIFYAERGADEQSNGKAQVSKSKRTNGKGRVSSRTPRRNSDLGSPKGMSIGSRAWRAAAPVGRTVLQVFPGLRPHAHRIKRAIILRQK